MSDEFLQHRRALLDARTRAKEAERLAFLARQRLVRTAGRVEQNDRVASATANTTSAAEHERAVAGMQTEGDTYERARQALAAAERAFAPLTDPREAINELSDDVPILLVPVRLETRFKNVTGSDGLRRELWVRIYPDDISVDSFEEVLSEAEVASARRYWVAHWQAGGVEAAERAAWRNLVASHGVGRSEWIVSRYRPDVSAAPPVRASGNDVLLIIASASPADAAVATALVAYWEAAWRAGDDDDARRDAWTRLQEAVGAGLATTLVEDVPANFNVEPPEGHTRTNIRVTVVFCPLPPADDVEHKSRSWSRPAHAALLPERFVFLGYRDDQEPLVHLGSAVASDLVVGPDPSAEGSGQLHHREDGSLHVPDDLRWMVDFDRAVDVGMAMRVPLSEDDATNGFDRVLVVGLRLASDEHMAANELEQLLQHHRYSHDGLSIIPQGTPTKNTADADAGSRRDRDLDADASFDRRRQTAPVPGGPWEQRTDGEWLTTLLGINHETMAGIAHADGHDQREARAMNTALWPATLGYWMQTMMQPVFGPGTVEFARQFFTRFVTARGALPALQFGDQPYGIVPATAFSRLQWLPVDIKSQVESGEASHLSHLGRLYGLVRRVEADWTELARDVAYAGKEGDVHQILLDIVGLHPSSVEFAQRYAETLESLFNQLQLCGMGHVFGPLYQAGMVQQAAADKLAELGYNADEDGDPVEILTKFFFGQHHVLTGGVVDEQPPSETELLPITASSDRNYLEWLVDAASSSLNSLYRQQGFADGPPKALLYLLMRHALQLGYHDTSVALQANAGMLTPDQVAKAKKDPPFLNVQARHGGNQSRYSSLMTAVPSITGDSATSLADYIGQNLAQLPDASRLREQVDAIRQLARVPTARLERAFAEHVDLCTHRLDAWRFGFLHYQLALMRQDGNIDDAAQPRGGVHVGAYAWLEDLRPRTGARTPASVPPDVRQVFERTTPGADDAPLERDDGNLGWIHAPSVNQAVAAAVLRGTHLADASDDNPASMAVDLSSARVRIALSLLEGIRSGQSLGALLGYRFERDLHDRHPDVEVDRFILDIRKAFPLVGDRIASTRTDDAVPIDAIEASNVIDGLALVEHVLESGDRHYPFGRQLPAANAAEAAAINAVVGQLLDAHDAVSDLALSEGVYQAVIGNHDRVASTLDAFGHGDFPPEPDVIRTPAQGTGITHRVALHLDTGVDPNVSPVDGIAMTPRAQAEPALNQWLAEVLPPLDKVGCVVTFRDAVTGSTLAREVTLADLDVQPIDVLWLLEHGPDQQMGQLDDRVVLATTRRWNPRPDGPIAVRYMDTIDADCSIFELFPLARSLRRTSQLSRPLSATDLELTVEADGAHDRRVTLDQQRVDLVHGVAMDLQDDLAASVTALSGLLDDRDTHHDDLVNGVDDMLDQATSLLSRAAKLSVPAAGWGFIGAERRRLFNRILDLAESGVTHWTARITTCDEAVVEADVLATTPDDEARSLLLRARRAVTHEPVGELPDTFVGLRDQVVGFRAALAAARDQLAAVAQTSQVRVGEVFEQVRVPLAAISLDAQDLDSGAIEDDIVRVCQDVLASLDEVAQRLTPRIASSQQHIAAAEAAASARAKVDAKIAALKALLGEDTVVVPEFRVEAAHGAELALALAKARDGSLLTYLVDDVGIDLPVDTWLYGAARVRAKLHGWEETVMHAGALGGTEPELSAMQLPHVADDVWLAMEFPEGANLGQEHLCYTASLPAGFDPAAGLAGLLIDEWSEVIPGDETETGLAFHYNRPGSQPPQSMLLVTPTAFRGAWQWPDLIDALHDTLHVARLRAVEPDHVARSDYAALLPATVMATTVNQLTISANLALNNDISPVAKVQL